jgi:hypothetical protein
MSSGHDVSEYEFTHIIIEITVIVASIYDLLHLPLILLYQASLLLYNVTH